MNENAMIGAHIRDLRMSKKYTLKQLAEESGLSVGFLSQLERGMSSVAIDSLARLAEILGSDLTSIFGALKPAAPEPVVHSFEAAPNPISPQIIQYLLSNDVTGFEMLPRLFVLMPQENEDEEIEMNTHGGEEFAYVLEGIVTVYLDGRRYTLYPGDSIQIRSNLSHNWINLTNKQARLLAVNVPNPFITGEAPHA